MNFLTSLVQVATGGLGQQVVELVKAYLPPDMPPEKRVELQQAAERLEIERLRAVAEAQLAAEEAINKRVAEYEGTAVDLKGIPVLGPFMLFLRGSQRIVIGYGTMVLDAKVFSGAWALQDPQIVATFYIANFLVLGFLFGERALQNVVPYIKDLIIAKGATK